MSLSEEEISSFIANKTITVGDNTFDEECFSLRAEFFPIEQENVDSDGQLDFTVVLDMNVTASLLGKRYAREFVNRVQKLRQAANLNINVRNPQVNFFPNFLGQHFGHLRIRKHWRRQCYPPGCQRQQREGQEQAQEECS